MTSLPFSSFSSDNSVQNACLWGFFLLIQEELTWKKGDREDRDDDSHIVVCRAFLSILSCCRPASPTAVTHTAIQVLNALSELHTEMTGYRWNRGYTRLTHTLSAQANYRQRDTSGGSDSEEEDTDKGETHSTHIYTQDRPSLILGIVESLCLVGNAKMHMITMEYGESLPAITAIAHLLTEVLFCLLEWCMAAHTQLFNVHPTCDRVRNRLFCLLDDCLHLCPAEAVFPEEFISACADVESASAMVLRHLLTRIHHYPLRQPMGPEQVISRITEEEDQNISDTHVHRDSRRIHMALQQHTIITAYQFNLASAPPSPSASQPICRIIMRDMTGKYVWDVQRVEEINPQLAQQVKHNRDRITAANMWNDIAGYQTTRTDSDRRRDRTTASSDGREDSITDWETESQQMNSQDSSDDDYDDECVDDEDDPFKMCDASAPSVGGDGNAALCPSTLSSCESGAGAEDEDNENGETECSDLVADVSAVPAYTSSAWGSDADDYPTSGHLQVDEDGNTCIVFVPLSSVKIVESMFVIPEERRAAPHQTQSVPRPASVHVPSQNDKLSLGVAMSMKQTTSNILHYLEVRRRRKQLFHKDRPRAASIVSISRSSPKAAGSQVPAATSTSTATATTFTSASVSAFSPQLPSSSSSPSLAVLLGASSPKSPGKPSPAFDFSVNKISHKTETADSSASAGALPEAIQTYHTVRQFLSHLYFPPLPTVDSLPLSVTCSSVSFLPDDGKVRRALKRLDLVPVRDCHKVGLLFVAAGQSSQSEVLANDSNSGSAAYHSFLSGLGWFVDLNKHPGFSGGLDASVNGSHSIYWCSSTRELMWHIGTLMPTVRDAAGISDKQQIAKKRQVGNDYVHVVWSEAEGEYQPSTISSQFNHVHIVIYPLYPVSDPASVSSASPSPSSFPPPVDFSSLQCRIQIFTKLSVPPFGPLQSNMQIPFPSLSFLVRLTAMNASRAIRYSTAGYEHPFPTRKRLIEQLTNKQLRREEQVRWQKAFSQTEITQTTTSPITQSFTPALAAR